MMRHATSSLYLDLSYLLLTLRVIESLIYLLYSYSANATSPIEANNISTEKEYFI